MTEVEKMEKQLLQLETFWELSSFITASVGTDIGNRVLRRLIWDTSYTGRPLTDASMASLDACGCSKCSTAATWRDLYVLARKNPQVRAHLEELVLSVSLGGRPRS